MITRFLGNLSADTMSRPKILITVYCCVFSKVSATISEVRLSQRDSLPNSRKKTVGQFAIAILLTPMVRAANRPTRIELLTSRTLVWGDRSAACTIVEHD